MNAPQRIPLIVFALRPDIWVSLLWHAMSTTGRGYRRHSLRRTGRRMKDGTWDRRADKVEGPMAGAPKALRSYRRRYESPPLRVSEKTLRRRRNAMRVLA